MALKTLTPILHTSDLPALVLFLQENLGFDFLWDVKPDGSDTAFYAGLQYDGAEVHAQAGESTPKEMHLYLQLDEVGSVDAMYETLKAKGAEPTEPKDQPYGMREIEVTGPEGTLIGYGAPISS